MLCASCPAIEELAAKDASLAALQEENDVLRAKVAALTEIAFGGSERRGGTGRDDDGDLGDLDDECTSGEGDAREPPGPVAGSDGEAGGVVGGKRRRGQRHGAPGHGRRRYDHLEVEVVLHELDEDERCCASYGSAYEPIAGGLERDLLACRGLPHRASPAPLPTKVWL